MNRNLKRFDTVTYRAAQNLMLTSEIVSISHGEMWLFNGSRSPLSAAHSAMRVTKSGYKPVKLSAR